MKCLQEERKVASVKEEEQEGAMECTHYGESKGDYSEDQTEGRKDE